MSELEQRSAMEPVIDPFSGQVVDCSDLAIAAEFLWLLRNDGKDAIADRINQVEGIILRRMAELGQGTVRVGRAQLQRKGGNEHEWDLEKLQELLDEGLPAERYDELVKTKTEYKVDLAVANQISAANPAFKVIIDAAHTVTPKKEHVGIEWGNPE